MTGLAPAQLITASLSQPPAPVQAVAGPGQALRAPGFLRLPARTVKPRAAGLLHVLDDGMPLANAGQYLEAAGPVIDIWKFGWGTAYLDQHLADKLALLARHGVRACTGGTLLEIAWQQGALAAFLDWAQDAGFPCIEVSCGTVDMSRRQKSELISIGARRFAVLAEVGRKDASAPVSAAQWAADAEADLKAGAVRVITEGRESGTVGLYQADGSVRADVAEAVVAAVGVERVLFEAPQRAQQAWLIRRYGANVNIGNVHPAAALSVEALRLGLRSDTATTPPDDGPPGDGPPDDDAPRRGEDSR